MAKIIKPKRFIISTSLVILILAFAGYQLFQLGKEYFGQKNSAFEKAASIPVEKNNDEINQQLTIAFKEKIALFHNNSLKVFNSDGTEAWSFGQRVKKPALYAGESFIFLVDKGSGYVNAIDDKGTVLWTVDLAKEVQDFTINDQGISVIVINKESSGSQALIFDQGGNSLGTIDIKTGDVMETAITRDGEVIALSLLTTENNIIETNIILYSKTGKLLGGNKYDEDIIMNMFFSEDNRLLSVGIDCIVAFDKEKGLLWKNSAPHSINKLAWNKEALLAINFTNKKKSILDPKPQSYIATMDLEGETISETPLNEGAIDIDFVGNNLVAIGSRTIYLFDQNSKQLLEKKIHKDIKEVHILKSNLLAIVMEGEIEIFKIH